MGEEKQVSAMIGGSQTLRLGPFVGATKVFWGGFFFAFPENREPCSTGRFVTHNGLRDAQRSSNPSVWCMTRDRPRTTANPGRDSRCDLAVHTLLTGLASNPKGTTGGSVSSAIGKPARTANRHVLMMTRWAAPTWGGLDWDGVGTTSCSGELGGWYIQLLRPRYGTADCDGTAVLRLWCRLSQAPTRRERVCVFMLGRLCTSFRVVPAARRPCSRPQRCSAAARCKSHAGIPITNSRRRGDDGGQSPMRVTARARTDL